MVLGKLPVPGRPTILITVGQGPTALAVGAGGGCLDIFTLIYPFFPLSPSLWETARYRLKYCLKGPLNPKPTNQPTVYILPKCSCASRRGPLYVCDTCPLRELAVQLSQLASEFSHFMFHRDVLPPQLFLMFGTPVTYLSPTPSV